MSAPERPGGLSTPHGDSPAAGPGGLPDLLALDLVALRTLRHPVLAEVVGDLRWRAEHPREMLWGFNSSPYTDPAAGDCVPEHPGAACEDGPAAGSGPGRC